MRRGTKWTVMSMMLLGNSLALVVPSSAWANERRFTYTYETGVLPAGARELEMWTTWRVRRDDYYSRFDQRAEFEFGLTDRLQTAIYLNARSVTQPSGGTLSTQFKFGGISSEWKYKLLDPVADALGFAIYGEVTGKPDEFELEAKLIFDKKIGNLLLAANVVVENEWKFGLDETERELALELDIAATYFVTDKFSAGVEIRNHNEFPGDKGWEHAALFAGPVLAYSEKSWWVALAVLPQLPALKPSSPTSALVLDEHEKVNARLLFSFHL